MPRPRLDTTRRDAIAQAADKNRRLRRWKRGQQAIRAERREWTERQAGAAMPSKNGSVVVRGERLGRRRAVRIGQLPTAGGVLHDPALILAHRIRGAFAPRDTLPGPIKVYAPDGTLKAVLDPFTRKPVTP